MTPRNSSAVTNPPGPAVSLGSLTKTLPPGCCATRNAMAASMGGASGMVMSSSGSFSDSARTSSVTFSFVQGMVRSCLSLRSGREFPGLHRLGERRGPGRDAELDENGLLGFALGCFAQHGADRLDEENGVLAVGGEFGFQVLPRWDLPRRWA